MNITENFLKIVKNSMQDIYAQKKQSFVIIIDEWDCIFREYKEDKEAQEKYLDFLRDLLNNCASHSRYFSDELDAQFFIKIS